MPLNEALSRLFCWRECLSQADRSAL